jgi:hypothetical protein
MACHGETIWITAWHALLQVRSRLCDSGEEVVRHRDCRQVILGVSIMSPSLDVR